MKEQQERLTQLTLLLISTLEQKPSEFQSEKFDTNQCKDQLDQTKTQSDIDRQQLQQEQNELEQRRREYWLSFPDSISLTVTFWCSKITLWFYNA